MVIQQQTTTLGIFGCSTMFCDVVVYMDRTVHIFWYVDLYMHRAVHTFWYVDFYMEREVHIMFGIWIIFGCCGPYRLIVV